MERLVLLDYKTISSTLLKWFRENGRDLPWRKTYNPYHVWISEIMLQQTQMDRGVKYFLKWIERFPEVQAVADAPEQEILKCWEGLGYYARARNLHKAAKKMVEVFSGQVPDEYQQLLRLPGIGPYTAAAIASVAGNHDVAAVDANVMRVYSRVFDIAEPVKSTKTQKKIQRLANDILPPGNARQFNQALMDLGGMVCKPKNTHCRVCPLHTVCLAHKRGIVNRRPILVKPKATVLIESVAGIIISDKKVFIQRRPHHSVWGGLWEFPGGLAENKEPGVAVHAQIKQTTGLSVKVVKPLVTVKHQYTNHKITLHSFLCELGVNTKSKIPVLQSAVEFRWICFSELSEFAFPAGPRKVVEYIHTKKPGLFV